MQIFGYLIIRFMVDICERISNRKVRKTNLTPKRKVFFENSWSTDGQEKQSILSFFLFPNMEVKHIMRRWSLSNVLIFFRLMSTFDEIESIKLQKDSFFFEIFSNQKYSNNSIYLTAAYFAWKQVALQILKYVTTMDLKWLCIGHINDLKRYEARYKHVPSSFA